VNNEALVPDLCRSTVHKTCKRSCHRGNHWKQLELKFDKCIGPFVIAGEKQYNFIVSKYTFNLHSLRNRPKQLAKDSFFYIFLTFVQMNVICFDNVCILQDA